MINLKRPYFWEKRYFLSFILLPLSFLYSFIVFVRFFITKPYKSTCYTVCVGNISSGGSGKTPIVSAIAKFYQSKGKKICVLSRGYKGRYKGPILVDSTKHSYLDVGDESLMLASKFPVIISKNKLKGVKFAEEKLFDIIIFDDGLQNPQIHYDIKIVSYNSSNLGNRLPFPAGPLRQPINFVLRNANYIFAVRGEKNYDLEKFYSKVKYYDIISDFKFDNTKKYFLFAGIANPNKFFEFANNIGGNNFLYAAYPDHHEYNCKDIEYIKSKMIDYEIITTEKDYVKFSGDIKEKLSYISIEYKFEDLLFVIPK